MSLLLAVLVAALDVEQGHGDLLVQRSSEPGELLVRLDVASSGVPASFVLARIAAEVDRSLSIEPGAAELHAASPLRVSLFDQPLSECLERIGEALDLGIELRRSQIRVSPDDPDDRGHEVLLRRALRHYRKALIDDPTQNDAGRIRFEIANILFRLGEHEEAVREYGVLQQQQPDFVESPLLSFRLGHALAALDRDQAAVEEWLSLTHQFRESELVVPAYLACVRAFRRLGDPVSAAAALRSVVEGEGMPMSPTVVVDTADLLREGGEPSRALVAYRRALGIDASPPLERRALYGMARCHEALGEWSEVAATIDRYLRAHSDGEHVPQLYLLLAQMHRQWQDPFITLLSLEQARRNRPDESLSARCDLLEGQVLAGIGLSDQAEGALVRAGHANDAAVAGEARLLLARLQRERGQVERARETLQVLLTQESFRDFHAAAEVGLLQIASQVGRWQEVWDRAGELLVTVEEPAQREELNRLAAESLRHLGPLTMNGPVRDTRADPEEPR